MTCWPPGLIRSALFGSMPSAMMPTLIPVPVTIWLAASTFITWRASGSTSGCAGLLGQICCVGALVWPRRPRWPRRGKAGPAPLPGDANCRLWSGTTARTPGLARSLLISAAETVAEIALMMW